MDRSHDGRFPIASAGIFFVGVAAALLFKKPLAIALGLATTATIFYAMRRMKREQEDGDGIAIIGNKPSEPALGAPRTRAEDGQARIRSREESGAAFDPSLYPVPHRVRTSRFEEDPSDERIRWSTEKPYTAWRGVNGIW